MAVYCEMRTDEGLLRDIGEAGRILLVGCPVCPNFSCAVHQQEDGPVMKLGLTGAKPLLLGTEMNRTAELLKQKGVSVVDDKGVFPARPQPEERKPEGTAQRGGPGFARAGTTRPGEAREDPVLSALAAEGFMNRPG